MKWGWSWRIYSTIFEADKLKYEKTFWPFILFSKKGILVINMNLKQVKRFQTNKYGSCFKTRDNADIVKHIYTGVINILMEKEILNYQ